MRPQGSLVEFDRLRFDFNLPRPMTPQEVASVESLINGWIQDPTPLATRVMALADAKAAGATAMFGEKYADVVRVVEVPGVSMELCGGTHVSSTGDIGGFKVLSESGIASGGLMKMSMHHVRDTRAGIRRIEAVSGPALMDYVHSLDGVVRELCSTFKVKQEEVPQRVAGELRMLAHEDVLKSAHRSFGRAESQGEAAGRAAFCAGTCQGSQPVCRGGGHGQWCQGGGCAA